MRVPPPGGAEITSVPPTAATRSSSPRSPGPVDVGPADAVVRDLEPQVSSSTPPRDPDRAGVCVLGDVGEGLGGDEVGGGLDARRKPAIQLEVDRHGNGRAVRERTHGGAQARLAKDRRVQALRELAELGDRRADLLGGRVQLRGDVVRDDRPEARPDRPQRQREGEQALLCAVVEVSLHAAPLGVGRLHDPRP